MNNINFPIHIWNKLWPGHISTCTESACMHLCAHWNYCWFDQYSSKSMYD